MNINKVIELGQKAAAYEGGNLGEYIVDFFNPWAVALAELIAEVAGKHGCELDGVEDRAGSRYTMIRKNDAEVCQVRLADHSQRYAGPAWSFSTSDCEADIVRGLNVVAEECEAAE